MSRVALPITDQYVGHATAFGPGKPRCNKCVRCIEQRVDPHRASRQKYGNDRNALVLERFQQCQIFAVLGFENQIRTITAIFGIGFFPEHNHRCVRTLAEFSIFGKRCRAAIGPKYIGYPFEDRLRIDKFIVAVVITLPIQRPSAGLLLDAVCTAACHQNILIGPERQNIVVVLQKHK